MRPGGFGPNASGKRVGSKQFRVFQRPNVTETVVFVVRPVAKRTPPGQRKSVQDEEYMVPAYNRNGLICLGFMDDHHRVRSAFSLLNQDPAEADKLLRIQCELDETKFILCPSRGEKLDSLGENSSDLSAASQMFYKQAKKTNQCCSIL